MEKNNPLENAAERIEENLADQVPDGVKGSPRDTADDSGDPRTGTNSSISEGLNARDENGVDVEDDVIPDRD